MGKSNHLNISKPVNKNDNLDNILNTNEIKILEKINGNFIKEIIIYFSKLVKNHIKLNFSSIKINSYTDNDQYIKYLYSHKIEILNSKKQSFIFFSDNLLSIFIDLLFGGNGECIEKITNIRNITYTEKIISKKILNLIINAYCKAFKKFFFIDINIINTKIINISEHSFKKEKFITNYFNLNINGINVFLSILVPFSVFRCNFKQTTISKINRRSSINNINLKQNIAINNLFDVELDVSAKLIMPPNLKLNYNSLSIGDILTIKSPDKIIAYIEKTPIFIGDYKVFHTKPVIFFKKFIHKNLDINKYEDVFNE